MKSKVAVRQQFRSALQILHVVLMTVIVMSALSGSSLAQGRLPFIGARTFCSEEDEGQATITIRKDGFTRVKSDMLAVDEVGPFAFSGMLNAKGILRRESGRYLEIISATAIRMHDGGGWIDGKPCSEVLARESSVLSVAFSPDGKTLASGNRSSTIKLWDAPSGQELKTLIGHSHSVTSIAFSPDGRTLVSASGDDSTIRLWDVASGQELKTLKERALSVAFSPDGKTLASGADTIKLWDVGSGRELKTLKAHSGVVWSVAFSPDGKTLESGSWDSTIKLWDVASGQALRTFKGDSKPVVSVAFSPDGKTLASGSLDITLWNVASGQVLKTLKRHSNTWTSVAFCSDGRTLASGGDENGAIKLWDVASGRELRTLTGHSSVVHSVAFSPDGKTLASGSDDKTIKLWDVASGQEFKTLKVLPKESRDVPRTPPAPRTDASERTGELPIKKNDPAPANIQLQPTQPIRKAPDRSTANSPAPTYIEVQFEKIKDLNGLTKSFPFLKEEIDGVIADNKEPGLQGPTNVYVSDLNQKGVPRLIFVAMDGRSCGSRGCSLTVHMDQGRGFRHALEALVDVESPIYISKDQLSLLTCGVRGRGEWTFKNNVFEATAGEPRPSQRLAPCATHTISDAADAGTTLTATSGPPAQPQTSGIPTGDTVNETNVDPAALELSYWESIRNSTDPEDFKAYLVKYPNGHFAELAKSRAVHPRLSRNPASGDVSAAERARNTQVFEVRDASKTTGWLTVAPGSLTFEPKKPQAGKNMTIQCSDIKHFERGQSAVASPHVNLFLTAVEPKEKPVVFYTSSGGTGLVGVFVKGLPAKPVVNITTNVMSAIAKACKLTPTSY